MSDLPLFHWHGDVAASHKTKALKEPRGILQITPESLESMLINRKNDIPRLFGDLRFIVLDELHSVMNSDRGRQIACQIARLDRLLGFHPRRVGLSATLGDKAAAAEFLGAGSGRETAYTSSGEDKPAWRLGIAHFFIQNDHFNQAVQNPSVVADAEMSDGGRLLPSSVSEDPPHGEEISEEIAQAYPAVEYPGREVPCREVSGREVPGREVPGRVRRSASAHGKTVRPTGRIRPTGRTAGKGGFRSRL